MSAKGGGESIKPEDLFDALRHEHRTRIIQLLYENVEMSYSDILNAMEVETGLLNFHLRKIKKYVRSTDGGTYTLSECGRLAYEIYRGADVRLQSLGFEAVGAGTRLHINTVVRRVLAFLLDTTIFFMSFGLFLDRNVWTLIYGLVTLKMESSLLASITYETLIHYSHVFFAVYIVFTILEAYKGQTLGKYLFGIRVVKTDMRKITLLDSSVRNLGKVFLLPLDILLGLVFYWHKGYLRFFDFYTNSTVERVYVRP